MKRGYPKVPVVRPPTKWLIISEVFKFQSETARLLQAEAACRRLFFYRLAVETETSNR
jgi:hypothetical protein